MCAGGVIQRGASAPRWHPGPCIVRGRGAVARQCRPRAATTKEAVKLRLDADVLTALRASGDGCQTRINDALRASLALAEKLV